VKSLKRIRPILAADVIRECCLESNIVLTDQAVLRLLDTAWRAVTLKFSDGSIKPIVFIVGAGAGAPRSLALRQITSNAFQKIRCFYDASHLSLTRTNDLIEQCHHSNQPTIVLYISQPLVDCAKAFINEAISTNRVPSASQFALSHFNALNTFLAISKRYKKKKPLLTTAIISYEPGEITYHKNLKLLRETSICLQTYESQLIDVWHDLQTNNDNLQPQSRPVISLKPVNSPRTIKTLNQATSFAAHLLAVSLRSNLLKDSKGQTRPPSTEERSTVSASQPQASPAQQLTRGRVLRNEAATAASLSTEHEGNDFGREQLLDDDRPLKIVVREKTTHPHEMETLRVR